MRFKLFNMAKNQQRQNFISQKSLHTVNYYINMVV